MRKYPECVAAALSISEWRLGDTLLEERGAAPDEKGHRHLRFYLENAAADIVASGGDEDTFSVDYSMRHSFSTSGGS